MTQPFPNTENLTDSERKIADLTVVTRGANKGRLRSSKPEAPKGADAETKMLYGSAAYVWRMTAFLIGSNRQDSCMPVTADFGIPIRDYKERMAYCKNELDPLVDKLTENVPASHGARAWGRAFGII